MKIGAHRGRGRSRQKSRARRFAVVAASVIPEIVVLKRRGYPPAGEVVVRCRRGHLFTTIWIPGVSVKSIRLSWWRVQRCPVGKHVSFVTPVRRSDLSEDELRAASENRDVRIP